MTVQSELATPATSNRITAAEIFSQFVRYVMKRLPLMALTFLLSSLVHLYLIYLNNGFDSSKVSKWTPYINVAANPGSSAFLLWTAVSALGWSFLYTIFKQGPVRAVTSIVMQPVNMVKKLFSSSMREYACWTLGGGCALIAAAYLDSNRPAGISMGLLWVMLGMSRTGQMAAQFIFNGLAQVMSGSLGRFRPSAELIQIVIAALGPGFLLAGLLGNGMLQGLAGVVALIASAYLLYRVFGGGKPGGIAQAAGQASVLLIVSGLSATVYALIGLLWTRSAFANDFGEGENGSFTNALKSGKDAVGPAIDKAVHGSGGTSLGPLMPPIEEPRVYGPTDPETGKTIPDPERPNPWDPDADKQRDMWTKDHVIWDPKTLSWRPPTPGEYPPPAGPPEILHTYTPFENQMPRDKVPPECLDLYDRYIKSQNVAMHGADDLKEASDAYWEAQRRYNQLLAKWTLITGAEVGQIAAGGLEAVHGAGVAARAAGNAAVDAARTAAQQGLRDIADRAAVEAAAAESEIASQSAMVTQLRQLSLDAAAEVSTARQALSTLKVAGGGIADAEGAVNSAAEELQAAEKAAAEAEGEVVVARNRVQRVKENIARGKEWNILEDERMRAEREINALWNEERQVGMEANRLQSERVSAELRNKKLAGVKEDWDLQQRANLLEERRLELAAEAKAKRITLGGPEDQAINQEKRAIQQRLDQLRSADYNEQLKAEVANQPLPPEEARLRAREQELNAAQKPMSRRIDELKERRDKLQAKIDPAYDQPTDYIYTVEQQLEHAEEAAKQAQAAQRQTRAKLTEAKQNLAKLQEAGSAQEKIAQQEAKIKQLDDKVNDLATKESEAAKKLRDAEQRKAEAIQRRQDAQSAISKDDGPSAPGAGGAPSVDVGVPTIGPGSGHPMINPRTGEVFPRDKNYDPFAGSVNKYKPDWAYWVEEKLHNGGEYIGEKLKKGFGVQSPDEIAQVMAEAKAALEAKFQTLQKKMAAFGAASSDLGMDVKPGDDYWNRVAEKAKSGVKAQLDQCIQSHTYWKGDGTDGGSASGQ